MNMPSNWPSPLPRRCPHVLFFPIREPLGGGHDDASPSEAVRVKLRPNGHSNSPAELSRPMASLRISSGDARTNRTSVKSGSLTPFSQRLGVLTEPTDPEDLPEMVAHLRSKIAMSIKPLEDEPDFHVKDDT
ncbi:unnamed protein product [Protopolystoma xenopodis]|uniref:Uncharacterized protein n=1 Tax=Protopolystoma xenopodis TaxID=117903 RepID=A0A448X7K4_9PLAT|nr:unnamed protein product [Protopolystoma xenopodis]